MDAPSVANITLPCSHYHQLSNATFFTVGRAPDVSTIEIQSADIVLQSAKLSLVQYLNNKRTSRLWNDVDKIGTEERIHIVCFLQ